jgi:hypothetical protein
LGIFQTITFCSGRENPATMIADRYRTIGARQTAVFYVPVLQLVFVTQITAGILCSHAP